MYNSVSEIRINENRLWDSLEEMAKVGPGVAGGCNRQALTDEDDEARNLFKKWCEDADLAVTIDEMGNMFALREGVNPKAAPVFTGSHLDTQPTGGKYDGVLGVLAGLEVVRTLNDHHLKTEHPVVIVNWTNEEGARFAPAMLSSGVFAGVYTTEWAYAREDADGKRFGDELERIGWKGEEKAGNREIHALYELHIEQGPILEAENKSIGIVTHGQGLSWTQITIIGKDAHTGSTPMRMRKNAALGMARILDAVDKIAWTYQPHAAGAAGQINIYPNSRNVVPGKAVFTVDFRSPDNAVIVEMENKLAENAERICHEMDLGLRMKKIGGFEPVAFDTKCVQTVRDISKRLGYPHMDIISGAGHDACWISQIAPTTMIMCPCVAGISHNEEEKITLEWASAGANVLFHSILETSVSVHE